MNPREFLSPGIRCPQTSPGKVARSLDLGCQADPGVEKVPPGRTGPGIPPPDARDSGGQPPGNGTLLGREMVLSN